MTKIMLVSFKIDDIISISTKKNTSVYYARSSER